MRKTKIICTLGPASWDVETIKSLTKNGLNAARINFSHGDHETHGRTIQNVKQAREELGMYIPVVLDTKGPEIRTKDLKVDAVMLKSDQEFVLTIDDIIGDETKVSVTYEDLIKDVEKGTRILIDDGLIELRVKDIVGNDVICQVINGGELGSKKGVNIPDVYVNLPSMTDKDIADIKFGIEQQVDFIAASFIRSASDVLAIRQLLEENGGGDIQIISKIESREGVNNIDEILEVSDGIMVARGDLGVEIQTEEVPLVQKLLISKANKAGKLVVTATQMLDSMIRNPRPTRAETTDVANAIFDGTDAIMLSGETAKGKYPLETVRTMATIAQRTEAAIDYVKRSQNVDGQTNIANAISRATVSAAHDLGASAIISVTQSGSTARKVSKNRPVCPILGCTTSEAVARQLNLMWGVTPVVVDKQDNTDEIFDKSVAKAVETGYAKTGDIVVITAGVPVATKGTTNLLKVHLVGDVLVKGTGFGKKSVTGKANVITTVQGQEQMFQQGDILVARATDNDYLPYIKKAAAVVVEDKDPSCHAAIAASALDIPVVIGAEDAAALLQRGMVVTVDSENGFVYNGVKK